MSDELAATPGRFRKLTGAPAAILRVLLITLTVLGSLWALEVHHHFEVKGWDEAQVTVRFWIIGVLFAFIALSTLKLR